MKKRIIISSVIIVMMVFTGCSKVKSINNEGSKVVSAPANFGKVKNIEWSNKIEVEGIIASNEIQQVTLPNVGTVKNVYVKSGDLVKKGTLLFDLDNSRTQYDIMVLNDKIEEEKINGTKSSLELLKMQKKMYEENVENSKAKAKIDGVITSVNIHEGDWAESGKVAVIIMDTSTLKAEINLNQLDIDQINIGDTAALSFSNIIDTTIQATVTEIDNYATAESDSYSHVGIKLTLIDPSENIIPGFKCKATFESKTNSYLAIPVDTIQFRANKPYVQKIMADGSLEDVYVETQFLGDGYAKLIKNNLVVGDKLKLIETQDYSMDGGF